MTVPSWILGGLLLALGVAGCGGSSHGSTTTSSSAAQPPGAPSPPAAGSPAALAAVSRSLSPRVLSAGELAGYDPQGSPSPAARASGWVVVDLYPPNQRAAEIARLQKLGFVAGLREHLAATSGNPSEAISVVEQFRTAQAAGRQVSSEAKPTGGASAFSVAGIPGGRGFGGSGPQGSGENVAFAKGPYLYLIGFGAPSGTSLPSRAVLSAAAVHLYRRVHG